MTLSFIDILLSRAQEQENGITFVEGDDSTAVTYGELVDTARRLAHVYRDAGIDKGQPVILSVADNQQLIYAFWALVWLGAVPVPIAVGSAPADKARLVRAHRFLSQPRVLVSSTVNLPAEIEEYVLIAGECENAMTEAQCEEPACVAPDDTRLIQFSSGSTGNPKGIVVTERNIVSGLQACVPQRRARVKNSMLTWLPLTHNMSLIGFNVYALFQNYPQYILPTRSFIQNPLSWLHAITRYRPTVTACPNFALRHVLGMMQRRPEQCQGLDLSSIHKIMCGSEPVDVNLAHKFQTTLEAFGLRPNAINTGYGLSEACLLVTVSGIYEPLHVARLNRSAIRDGARWDDLIAENGAEFVSVGRPVPGIEMTVRDEEGNDVGADVIGEIYVAGEPVSHSIIGHDGIIPQQLAPDGALPTGDIGVLHDGELYVVGRKKDVLFIGGKNYYANDLEMIVEDKLGVETVVCAQKDQTKGVEEIIVCAQRDDAHDENTTARNIRQLLMSETGVGAAQVVWRDTLPKTANGKKARHTANLGIDE